MRDLARALRSSPGKEMAEAFAPLGEWVNMDSLNDFSPQARPHSLGLPENSSILAPLGTAFHQKAGSLTPGVLKNLKKLSEGAPVIRLSHQPNFGAYLKLFALFIGAGVAIPETASPSVYIVNDCDVIGNERFRRCIVPDVTRPKGYEYISLPTAQASHDTLASRAARPSASWLQEVIERLSTHLDQESRLIRVPPQDGALPMEELAEDLHFARDTAENLTDFTSILLSRLVNLRLGLDNVFLSGGELWRSVGTSVLVNLLGQWDEVVAAQHAVARRLARFPALAFNWNWLHDEQLAPVWLVCGCDRRQRLRIAEKGNLLIGRCNPCGAETRLGKEELGEALTEGRLVPRVGLLDLTENAFGALSGGVTYMSSGTHSFIYGLVGREMGISPMKQIFLDVRGTFDTPVERLAQSQWRPKSAVGLEEATKLVQEGWASCLYYLTRLDRRTLLSGLQEWLASRSFDEPVNI